MGNIKRFEIVDSHKDIAPLFNTLLANSAAMGFEFVSFWGMEGEEDVIKDSSFPCIAASWSADFVHRYAERGYYEIDPFTHMLPVSDSSLTFNMLRNMNSDYFNEIATFGLRDGAGVPVRIGNRLYTVGFCTSRDAGIRPDEQGTLESMAFRFVQDYMRAETRPAANNRNETEEKILAMALSGFSDDAIAEFLGLTESYVSTCRWGAMEKLGYRAPHGKSVRSSRMISVPLHGTSTALRQ